MSFWRRPKPDPPWLTGIPVGPVSWPPVHAGRLQSLSYDPKHDDSLELNVKVAWYQARMDGRVKAKQPMPHITDGAIETAAGEATDPTVLSSTTVGTATA